MAIYNSRKILGTLLVLGAVSGAYLEPIPVTKNWGEIAAIGFIIQCCSCLQAEG